MANEYILEKFTSGMHYIMLEPSEVPGLTQEGNKRVVCTVNDQLNFHCAIMQKKEGGHFINIGSAICKKLGISRGSKVMATFTVDKSRYQFEIPEEFQEVLNTDPEAEAIFHSLTAGNQRSLIYLVTQAKSSGKRIERALKIVEKNKAWRHFTKNSFETLMHCFFNI